MPGMIADGEEEFEERGDNDNDEDMNDSRQQDNNVVGDNSPLGLDSPRRMDLTEYERDLAINIREAIAATPEVDPVSDFMCAQLALIDGDDTEAAIERVQHLQCFREEYGILDTARDGRKCFADFISLFPGFHLSYEYAPEHHNYIMIYDTGKFHCSEICSEEKLRAWMGGTYYTGVVYCPDFEAIRSGCVMVCECEGYDWKKNMDFNSLKKVWSEMAYYYPFCLQKVRYLNAPNSMNIVANMMKPFLPEHLRSKLEFGCQFDERLDSIYMVPTVEAANLRLLARLEETLNRRYENEQTFRL